MISYYKKLVFFILFSSQISEAQLAVCYDTDGYTNVRKSPDINSKIIGKILEGQVFAIATYTQEYENKAADWIAVSFPLTNNLSEKDFLKFDGEENLGYVHKSRFVKLEDLPKLSTEIDTNKVLHRGEDVQLAIETQVFNKSNHKIIQTKEGGFLVDGKEAYPYYGEEKVTEIKNITWKNTGKTYSFQKKSFKNLFRINASNTKVYKGNKEEYYLVLDAGDGADGYEIIYCIKNNIIFSMTTTSTLP